MKKTEYAELKTIAPEEIPGNPFQLIGNDWMLITAGNLQNYNTMTASWGGLGVLWGKQVCFCFIRPQRYTYQFTESEAGFTLSFFDERYRNALSFCGANSGRDFADSSAGNKAVHAGLTPVAVKPGRVFFQEARLVIECRKIYFQDLDPEHFLAPDIEKNYHHQDYHRMYIGEIETCYLKN